METLIPIVNQLQDVFNAIGGELVELPQIAVIGCQSCGKSSVLESIVGRDFLPRGTGIVTRRPLILQLVHAGQGEPSFCEFLHKKGQNFSSFPEICREIAAETERTTGKGKNVSAQPINLRIQSPYVPTLTLVDLPGLTKVAVEGQDPEIVESIRSMVLQYITPKTALILAVTPANQDLANSDSLKLAREVDPDGERTIGVITKLDLMDAGTDASAVLRNEIYPLRLGYIGVVNRSQKDIEMNKTITDAYKKEKEFFENNPVYRGVAERCGCKVLSTTLNRLLLEHIKKTIPSLRQRVTQLIQDKEAEIEKLGPDPRTGMLNPQERLLGMITSYVSGFEDLIAGKVGNQIDDDLKGGARISRIFSESFERDIAAIPPIQGQDPDEIMYLTRNHAGISVPIFVSHQAFESLIRRHVELLRPPALKAISLVANEILNIHAQVTFPDLERYPQVKDAIRTVVEELVNSCVDPSVQFVNDVIENEKIFINTARHDFRGAAILAERRGREAAPVRRTKQEIADDERRTLVSLCARYFELVRTQIVDLVPKAVVMMLVEGSSKQLRDALLKKIYGSETLIDLSEDPRIEQKRKKAKELLEALRKAQTILQKVRQLSI